MSKYFAVYIEWIDSTMKLPVWHSKEDLMGTTKKVNDVFKTISHLVSENKDEYILAASIHYELGEVVSFGQVFTIPKGCVIKFQKITNINYNATK